jgi:nucleoside-diphosphate kinase
MPPSKKVVGEIISRFEKEGLKLLAIKMIKPNREIVEEFYSSHRGRDYFKGFIDFMTSAPIIVTVFEGENAVNRVREIIGSTDSREAAPNTLRFMYGTDDRRNLIHAADSKENAKREIEFFFNLKEIFVYDENTWKPK